MSFFLWLLVAHFALSLAASVMKAGGWEQKSYGPGWHAADAALYGGLLVGVLVYGGVV